ncbi:transposase [Bombilactobacillus bombi]|nr:transposase [Bombilactobacillus bombi]
MTKYSEEFKAKVVKEYLTGRISYKRNLRLSEDPFLCHKGGVQMFTNDGQ